MAPVILVTNDDGIHARGLSVLAEALAPLGEVYVVAPDREQSAVGHALTLHRPLRVDRVADRKFAVNGTPSDCVNLAVLGLLPEPPVLVAAGVNHGSNLGDDVTYSGTVSAAMEGTLLGVASMAVSQSDPEADDNGFEAAGEVARAVHRVYREKVIREVDPRGRPYYWIGAGPPEWAEDAASDIAAVHAGFASVTPLHLDLTHHGALGRMTEWEGALNAVLMKRKR
jgi:5'-nucleotidase